MGTKETQEQVVSVMSRWQKVENASIGSTGRIIEKTDNPLIRLVMEIIQRDSQTHFRIQGMIADSLSAPTRTVHVSPDEIAEVWEAIEKHLKLEKQNIVLAREALTAIKGRQMVVQEYLLNYLLTDEEKHNEMLENLELIKKGMYPYG